MTKSLLYLSQRKPLPKPKMRLLPHLTTTLLLQQRRHSQNGTTSLAAKENQARRNSKTQASVMKKDGRTGTKRWTRISMKGPHQGFLAGSTRGRAEEVIGLMSPCRDTVRHRDTQFYSYVYRRNQHINAIVAVTKGFEAWAS